MPLFVHVQDSRAGRWVALAEGDACIGRAADCQVRIDDATVSRHHAGLRVVGGQAWVRDLGSRNGTTLDDAPLQDERAWPLGSRLLVASIPLELSDRVDDVVPGARESATGTPLAELSMWDGGGRPRADIDRAFRAVAAAGELLARPRAPHEITEPVLDLVEEALQPERITLLLRDVATGELVMHASRARDGGREGLAPLSTALAQRVLEERTSFLIGDVLADPQLRQRESIILSHVRTALIAPLFDNTDVLGILYADRSDPLRPFQNDDLRILTLLGNLIAMALTQARLGEVEQERRRLADEIVAARSVLARIICDDPPAPAGWHVCPHLEPCSEIGGDFYDVYPCGDGRWSIVLGDVSGHGLGATLLVAQIIPTLRVLLSTDDDLVSVMRRLNEHVHRNTAPHQFATVFAGVFDPATGDLEYVNAGHVPPFLLDAGAGGAPRRLASCGPPIGIVADSALAARRERLDPGDALLACSDGVTECVDPAGEMFGEHRTAAAIASLGGRGARIVLDAVLAAVASHRGIADSADDVALLVVSRDRSVV